MSAGATAVDSQETTNKDVDDPKNENTFIHHSKAVYEQREPYGPPGIRGVLVNHFAALCAAFAALGKYISELSSPLLSCLGTCLGSRSFVLLFDVKLTTKFT